MKSEALAAQKLPSSTPRWLTELANASARRMATAGSWQPSSGFRPAETPAAIRSVLASSAVPELVIQYEAELDAAFAQARETGDLTVLTTAVRRWWIEALAWQQDPAGQRDFLTRMDRYLVSGPPGPEHRVTREEFRAQLGAQRRPGEPDRPLRTLPFGQAGLVTFPGVRA